jgi:hypothetical protein
MPTPTDLLETARLQQTYGDLRAGFTQHTHFKGPERVLSAVQAQPAVGGGRVRTIVMAEAVDPITSERSFKPQ